MKMYNHANRREIHVFLAIILLMLLLIGCQSTSDEAVTTQPTSETISIEESPTKEPSKTPSLTLTPPTSTPDANSLELPAWVKNPSSQIILFKYDASSERSSEIGFFNAASGEQAIIKLPFEIYQYYWKDAKHIVFLEGYCSEPIVRVTELDISQGILSPSTAENLPKDIASCYGLEDKTEKIKIDATLPEPTIEEFDSSSGSWFRVTDPNDGISDIRFELSPNEDYLGIVQIQGKYDFPELWQPLFGTQVSVYHLPDRKLVASFAEEKEVSSMLLFTDNENLVYVRENMPCVISVVEKTKKCIHAIADRFPESTIVLGDSLQDREKLGFLYFSNYPYRGGWCIYNLFSGTLVCPTDEFEDLKEQTVLNYALSPDDNYLLIEYDDKGCPAPWCDYANNPQIAVIDISRKKIFHLGDSGTYQVIDIFGYPKPWRPSP